MRHYKFSVYFVGRGEEVVYASCQSDAVILACASRIKKGFHREALQIHNHDTGEMRGLKGSEPLTVNYIG